MTRTFETACRAFRSSSPQSSTLLTPLSRPSGGERALKHRKHPADRFSEFPINPCRLLHTNRQTSVVPFREWRRSFSGFAEACLAPFGRTRKKRGAFLYKVREFPSQSAEVCDAKCGTFQSSVPHPLKRGTCPRLSACRRRQGVGWEQGRTSAADPSEKCRRFGAGFGDLRAENRGFLSDDMEN